MSTTPPRSPFVFNENGHATSTSTGPDLVTRSIQFTPTVPAAFLPTGPRSLCTISLNSFSLGIAFGFTVSASVFLAYNEVSIWRLPAFIAVLACFHYLEFDMTARYNTADARVSSFLFNNGRAYTVAHLTAMVECTLRFALRRMGYMGSGLWVKLPDVLPTVPSYVSVLLGVVLIVLGQVTRSLAMKTAGTSFNHIVQSTKKSDHVLVTDGIYAWSRHPSYLGFFWWGLGTQFLLGNYLCFLLYGGILWKFFATRIAHEEKHLIHFFGDAYLRYRSRTPVLIPFIR